MKVWKYESMKVYIEKITKLILNASKRACGSFGRFGMDIDKDIHESNFVDKTKLDFILSTYVSSC